MTVVAFLQNMWVRDPVKIRAMIEPFSPSREVLRLRLIKYSLFAGCLTGRRLKAAFRDYVDVIHWEESTREIAGDPKTIFPADLAHMRAVIEAKKPDIVLTFGAIACDAVVKLGMEGFYHLPSPHPAARGAQVKDQLQLTASKLHRLLRTQEAF